LFRQQFGDLLKGAAASDLTSRLLAYAAKAAVWVAGLALPLLIWIGYLYLCYWAIANDKVLPALDRQYDQSERMKWNKEGMPACVRESGPEVCRVISSSIPRQGRFLLPRSAARRANPSEKNPVTVTSHIPGWLLSFARPLGLNPACWSKTSFGNSVNWPMAFLYIATAFVLSLVSWILGPNANSLHRLYRDRLSKAFLFNPKFYADGGPVRNQPSLDQGRDFLPLDDEKLSRLLYPTVFPPEEQKSGVAGNDPPPMLKQTISAKQELVSPYHLINTALNIQGSDFANRRGRNADFFLFLAVACGQRSDRLCGNG